MPATGFTPIQLFHSSTSGTLPTTSQLFTGEIFWNIADNKVYGLNSAGSALQTIVGSLGNQNANTVAITGGSINGTLIGNITPSSGIFTSVVSSNPSINPNNGVNTFSLQAYGSFGGGISLLDGTYAWGMYDESGTFLIGNSISGGTGALVPRVSILSSGYVGIGTIAPTALTTINGTLNFGNSGGVPMSISNDFGSNAYLTFGGGTSGFRWVNSGNSAEFMRLDSSGNLGLGVMPSAWGSGKAFEIGYTGNAIYSFTQTDINYSLNAYYNGTNWIYCSSNPVTLYSQISGTHVWQIAPSGTAGSTISFTQAMTLDNSGRLLVNTTSPIDTNAFVSFYAKIGGYALATYVNSTSPSSQIYFWNPNGPVGSISTSGTTTSFNTTSDQRLKTDLGLASQSRILDLKIHDYEWKSDGFKARGVFAQEAYEVIPEAVSVGNDETDENENLKKPWAVDYSKFVPDLIVMVQEQQEMINQLKAEIAELKGAK